MKTLLLSMLMMSFGCLDRDSSDGPRFSTAWTDLCQDGHDCTHLPPTCAQLGCPYSPSGTSYTWTPCPISQSLCWCWSPITNDEARQCVPTYH